MLIYVQLLTGKKIQLQVQAHDKVGDVVAKIAEMEGIHRYCQRLSFEGQFSLL